LPDEEEVGNYLTASDVVVLPFVDGASYRRGSLMAAIRYGCPIVTTNPQVQIPTFIDGENMRLFEAGNSRALANALRDLYQSPELRERLRNGAAQLSQHFDWSQIASDYTNFLYWVIESRA
jgi:glycosyltransferase involved in cell wall biosynthesis